ncbi:MAG: LAGLIDADG family homing endonuclease [Nanoarchaeota archaeon]|nr:LAGLIDADG family homing endonuclease [Nanoarchaeota archaeon]
MFEKIVGIKTNVKSVYNGKWFRILFQSIILYRILNKVFDFPYGYKKGKLKIPTVFNNASLELRKYFLIGFFDGDGRCSYLNKNRKTYPFVSVSQSSRGILCDLNKILSEAKLGFNIYEKRRDSFGWYVLETKDKKKIKRFKEEFGFLYPNKKKD